MPGSISKTSSLERIEPLETAASTDVEKADYSSKIAVTHEVNEIDKTPDKAENVLSSRRAFLSWLLLCYSTGPTSSMVFVYIPAVLQSLANILGHQPGSKKKCATRGKIQCVVKFGAGDIDYNSFVLYLNAVSRAVEGILTIFVSGIADYSHYRKSFMLVAIIAFGALALPFAALRQKTYGMLTAASVLYCIMSSINGTYAVMESSYIPLFMRASGFYRPRPKIQNGRIVQGEDDTKSDDDDVKDKPEDITSKKLSLKTGVRVSVLGLVVSNIGALTALLIGLIITNVQGAAAGNGFHSFLIAITIAGCLTIVFGSIGGFVIPRVPGMKSDGSNLFLLSLRRFVALIRSIRHYPEAFKFCVGWILWNTGYGAHNRILGLLFRETLGLGISDGEYTTWTFTAILFACVGSLSWMFLFPKVPCKVKMWAYIFLSVNIICAVWGAFGIPSHVTIGYKHRVEFWIEQLLFMATSSALRSLNRVVYGSMLPRGREAQFYGLELTLDLATGWISPLVQGAIQDRTHNLRWPMIPNAMLMVIALGFYMWVDIEKGMADALKPEPARKAKAGKRGDGTG
ncbi:MAG: hypothetical protein M1814_002796 [Vezdaea aestivalis]|nr:MAG: hypothetical protein M1814_002796 [Vezdaea aestivalis]